MIRNAKMVCSECPMVPVGALCYSAVPAGRPACLQRPQRRPAGFGRTGRRGGQLRYGPGDAGRPDVPEIAVSENQQTVATGKSITNLTTSQSNDLRTGCMSARPKFFRRENLKLPRRI